MTSVITSAAFVFFCIIRTYTPPTNTLTLHYFPLLHFQLVHLWRILVTFLQKTEAGGRTIMPTDNFSRAAILPLFLTLQTGKEKAF